jgi:uncharacterized protein (TIGR02599 family)
MTPPRSSPRRKAAGLTILELLISLTIFAVVIIIIAQAVTTVQATWLKTRSRADEYRSTRIALETMGRRLSQATLATHWVTPDDNSSVTPTPRRESSLHFICGDAKQMLGNGEYTGSAVFFQAPFGQSISPQKAIGGATKVEHSHLTQTLNAWGFFVQKTSDARERPSFLNDQPDLAPTRDRYRLYEFRQPTSELPLFKMEPGGSNLSAPKPLLDGLSSPSNRGWFTEPLGKSEPKDRHISLLADNIIAIIIRPLPRPSAGQVSTNSSSYEYDSRIEDTHQDAKANRHRLPVAVQLIAVALSEDHLQHLELDVGAANGEASRVAGAIGGKFKDPANIDNDLTSLEAELSRDKIPHAIVTETVVIPEGNEEL